MMDYYDCFDGRYHYTIREYLYLLVYISSSGYDFSFFPYDYFSSLIA